MTLTPSYVTVDSQATASDITAASETNASLYSSAVAATLNSLALTTSSANSYLSSAIAATSPSSAGTFTVTTGSLAQQGLVLDGSESDASLPTATGSGVTILSAATSGNSLQDAAGNRYTINWGTINDGIQGTVVTGLSIGDTVTKNWKKIGTLNGKKINVTVTFTVDSTQTNTPQLMISSHFGTFVTARDVAGHFQLSYTWAEGAQAGQALTLSDINSMSILGASLTPENSNGKD